MKLPIVAPSLLAADFMRLDAEIAMVNESAAEWLHLDVMDGSFVPNISFGPFIIEQISKKCTKLLDVHLMMVQPEKYIELFRKSGAQVITVHEEACTHLHRTLGQIRDSGAASGVALNPHTPVESLRDVLYLADVVCLMSVNPGFGGQKFIERTYRKVAELRELIEREGSKTLIEIDGGVGVGNAAALVAAGADVLVAGSSVFGAAQPSQAVLDIKNSVRALPA